MSYEVQPGESSSLDLTPDPQQNDVTKGNTAGRLLRYGLIALAAIVLLATAGWFFWNRAANGNEAPQAGVDFVLPVYEPAAATPALTTAEDSDTMAPQPPVVDAESEASVESPANVESTNPGLNAASTAASSESLETATVAAVPLVPAVQEAVNAAPIQASALKSELIAVVRGREATLSDRPDGTVLQSLPTGEPLTATGRSPDGDWIYVRLFDGASGWVELDQLVIFNTGDLPLREAGSEAMAANAQDAPEPSVDSPVDSSAISAAPAPWASADGLLAETEDPKMLVSVALSESRLNVRAGPSTRYAIVAKANPGEDFAALARNEAANWVQVELPDTPGEIAWVSAQYLTLGDAIENLPVSDRTGSTPATTAAMTAPAQRTRSAGDLQGNLAIQSGNGGPIVLYNLFSGTQRTLTRGYDPAISPDGRTVAFARGGGEHGIYLIDIDGSNERRIYRGGEELRAPSWSPDGQSLVFVRALDSYKCREVGIGICLPDNPFLDSLPVGSQPQSGLSQIDINGENYRDLAAMPSAQAPDWAEGGIVYSADKSIEITEEEPGADTRRVVGGSFYQDPDWQPGGGRIVFQSREGTHWEIFATNPDGSGLTALTKPQSVLVDVFPHNVAPVWSGDGQHIIYLSNRDSNDEAGDWRIWVMNADGSDQRPLPIDIPLNYNYANEQMVSWGPPL